MELKDVNGAPRLETYGAFDHRIDIAREMDKAKIQETAAYIKALCAASGVHTTQVVAAIPSFSVYSQIIAMPKVDKKELESAIRGEFSKLVPKSLEELVVDWKIVGGDDTISSANSVFSLAQDKNTKAVMSQNVQKKVLVTATDKKMVERYVSLFKEAGLTLTSLETESFASIRALLGKDMTPTLIADIGASTMDITLVTELVPVISRSLNVGGDVITQAISEITKLDLDLSEQFKKDVTYYNKSSEFPVSLQKALEPIINEMKYTIDLYVNRTGKKVERVILTGGSSLFDSFAQRLEEALNVKVFIGNSWASVTHPGPMSEVLEDIASRYTIAIGLALRNFKK